METVDACVLKREHKETVREFRYALMRFVRGFGWPIFFSGLAMLCMGLFFALLSMPNALAWIFTLGRYSGGTCEVNPFGFPPIVTCLSGLTIVAFALLGMAVGDAMKTPYQLESEMPTTYARVCHSCGKQLPKELIVYSCPECGRLFPLGPVAFLARLANKAITIMHIVIWLAVVVVFCR